jgi:HSP20 family protein
MTQVEERYIAPRVNVVEREDAVVIEAEVPGVTREKAEIEVRDGVLHLKAHTNAPANGGAYRIQERAGASYYRTFRLGEAIDTSKIDAQLKDGVLTLTLAKSERLKPRTISVN